MSAPLRRREALALIGAAAMAPRFARAATGEQRAAPMRRGFNLPDQVPSRPDQRPDRATLNWLRQRGMTHIRLPIGGESLMTRFSSPATIRATVDDFERILDLLLGLDFAVSADMHASDEFGRLHRADPEAALAALTESWRNLVRPIQRLPANRVFVELLNEPHTGDAIWRDQAARLAADLRKDLPSTTFIVGPAPATDLAPARRRLRRALSQALVRRRAADLRSLRGRTSGPCRRRTIHFSSKLDWRLGGTLF